MIRKQDRIRQFATKLAGRLLGWAGGGDRQPLPATVFASMQGALANGGPAERANATSAPMKATPTSEEYWSAHNVTSHRAFASAAESLEYADWRNDQYIGYLELLPVSGHDGEVILDFGCGPGNDLVGFGVYSKPSRLIAMDVSQPSLKEAEARLRLHGVRAEFVKIRETEHTLPLESASVDYIHCSGVLMTVEDPLRTLKEFHRILKPGGRVRAMVYNAHSLWLHLHVAYRLMICDPAFQNFSMTEAFNKSTDGEGCPVNRCWRTEEFLELGTAAGFEARHLGNAISLFEMELLPQRFAAMQSQALPGEHRQFLMNLEFDRRGLPYWHGQVAGIDGCFELVRPA